MTWALPTLLPLGALLDQLQLLLLYSAFAWETFCAAQFNPQDRTASMSILSGKRLNALINIIADGKF